MFFRRLSFIFVSNLIGFWNPLKLQHFPIVLLIRIYVFICEKNQTFFREYKISSTISFALGRRVGAGKGAIDGGDWFVWKSFAIGIFVV